MYWQWFARGTGGKAGYRRILNTWIVFHVVVGAVMAFVVDSPLKEVANTVLVPLVSVLVGLSFAWGGNALALLQTKQIRALARKHPGGFPEYVFVFQTAILVVLCASTAWAMAGLGVLDGKEWFWLIVVGIKSLLFALASLTVRECWHVVIGTQNLLLAQWSIDNETKDADEP